MLSRILKRHHDFLLCPKKETSRVLFYDKLWLLSCAQLVPGVFGLVGFALYYETFICVDKLGETCKKPASMRDLHFPLVSSYTYMRKFEFCVHVVVR